MTPAEYTNRPDEAREAARGAAWRAVDEARHHLAQLLLAEAGVQVRRVLPTATSLVVTFDHDEAGWSADLICATTADGTVLWHQDHVEWPDASLVCDVLASARDNDAHLDVLAGQVHGSYVIDVAPVPLTAEVVLAAAVGDVITTPDGPMIVAGGHWRQGQADRAASAGPVGSPQWRKAIGPYEELMLTGDGRNAIMQWCSCGGSWSESDWVAYARWDATGRVGHGFVHRICRQITQTG